jgi:ABC-2 type transport system ATP-binding protein
LEKDKKTAGNFSLGMRQRLGIAMALLGDPEFLILDEPMNGLDPAGIVEIRELILKLNKEKGITFLISSHILSELSLVATKYGFISKGKLLKEISAETLNRECTPSIYFEAEDNDKLQSVLLSLGIGEVIKEGSGVRVYTSVEFNEVLVKVSAECKIKVVNNASAGLEDYYLSLMGGERNA